MSAKKSAKPVNKTAFVKDLPSTMPAKDVVAKARAAGITLTEMYVYSIRSKSKGKSHDGPRRGPGRPPKAQGAPAASSGGLVSEIESIVEIKVNAILNARFGALFR